MPTVTPSGAILGARIAGIDLAAPLSRDDFALILRTLAAYGVVCFPNQHLDPAAQAAFSRRFGTLEVHVSGAFQVPDHPEVMILSNMQENGRPIGLADAGQDWHTDMSFSRTIAFVNVLHALKVPRRDGRVLGDTLFADMAAAFDDLPPALQARLETLTATHDFAKFWDMMRARGGAGSARNPLTQAQRAQKPPVSQPMVLRHPLSNRRILYANPGYTMRIDGLPAAESNALLEQLFAHQLLPRYQYAHHWTEGDVLMWDNIRTMHYAVPDYGPTEHRLVRRCQAMADRVFEPGFAALTVS
ncbi:MAG TPA: TauD/TfdA family dioxygenase [Acetobacteraceae bacterium]|nr:TauD/TfdA family dioxygenase [Acetobacteraceae bacterium]